MNELLKRTQRSESVNIADNQSNLYSHNFQFFDGLQRRVNRSGSLYIEPKVTDFVIEKSEKHKKASSALYLKDRGVLRYMLLSGDIESARNLIVTKFKVLYDTSFKVQAYLDVLSFIGFISEKDL